MTLISAGACGCALPMVQCGTCGKRNKRGTRCAGAEAFQGERLPGADGWPGRAHQVHSSHTASQPHLSPKTGTCRPGCMAPMAVLGLVCTARQADRPVAKECVPCCRPWIFQEAKEGRELQLSARERVGIYRRLVAHMKEHFGDDAMGRRKAFYFLPWHFDFLCRYR